MRMEIDKAYFTLPEVLDRWSLAMTDLIYLAENDKLRLSVRVFAIPVEFGDYEVIGEGEEHRMPWEQSRYSGLLDLYPCDAFQLFHVGEARIFQFRSARAAYACLWGGTEPLLVQPNNLVIRREERDRFETETGFAGDVEVPADFFASSDYQEVHCNGHMFRLGPIQAEVVRLLHEAALAGEPWCNGKALLTAVGSKSLKMSDVLKSQPHWRALIVSDRRGNYRLNFG